MKNLMLALVVIFSVGLANAQTEVGDATLPNQMTIEGTDLVLNGAGMREKVVFDLYAGGLYLQSKSSDAKSIINADETMVIKLDIVSKLVSSSKMTDAVDEGFEAATDDNIGPLEDRIEKFKSFFKDKIVKTNVFDIAYIKGVGSVVYKNGTKIGVIEGMDFKKALFAIWLGEDPADEDLKEGMLGID